VTKPHRYLGCIERLQPQAIPNKYFACLRPTTVQHLLLITAATAFNSMAGGNNVVGSGNIVLKKDTFAEDPHASASLIAQGHLR